MSKRSKRRTRPRQAGSERSLDRWQRGMRAYATGLRRMAREADRMASSIGRAERR
jgi:hypothetical protein